MNVPRPQRYALSVPLSVVHAGGYTVGQLVNISATGLYARVTGRIAPGTPLRCELDAGAHHLVLDGRVVTTRARGDDEACGIGVEFDVPSPLLWPLLDDLDAGRLGRGAVRPLRDDPRGAGGGGGAAPSPPPPLPDRALCVDRPFTAYDPPGDGEAAAPGGPRHEDRRGARYPVRVVALLDQDKLGGRVRVHDLSFEGARVTLEPRLYALGRPGELVRFRMNFLRWGPLALWSRVAWVEEEELGRMVGLVFVDVPDECAEPLRAVVATLAGEGGAARLAAESKIRP